MTKAINSSMRFYTIDPTTGSVMGEYDTMTGDEIIQISKECHEAFLSWRDVPLEDRIPHYLRLAEVLRDNKDEYSRLMVREMGKPISEALAEVEKCAWTAEVFAENAVEWLAPESIVADGLEHQVSYEPLGVILSIMPWNFPFWQALRFAIPTTLAGNVSILKHSNTVPGCAMAIRFAFMKAGFPKDVFRTIIAGHDDVAPLLNSDLIKGVSLTGSTAAGSMVASSAGQGLKKVVLELGGSDPFIVMADADIEKAAGNAVIGRMMNNGQSCIAAKRFIVHESVLKSFSTLFAEKVSALKVGDPMSPETQIGPIVDQHALEEVDGQVRDAVEKGASILAGGNIRQGTGFFYMPTVIGNVDLDMRVMKEEVFGPVAPIISFKDDDEAIKIANMTEFGLGGSVWTSDLDNGKRIASRIEAGTVFINSITKSDPRVPFGGIKKSGIGRELGKFGIREFTNIKSLNVYES